MNSDSGLDPQFVKALAGRFVVEREVGRGGTATVYLATDLRHKRQVAIKVLHPSVATSISEQRFLLEIATAARLTHPNIVPVLDSGKAVGLLYYVMPYIVDQTLREMLHERGALPVADALRTAAELAEALDYAHRQNVVHRDIKPGNILFVDNRPVITDFGVALVPRDTGAERLTQPEEGGVGTAAYMSPEQASWGAPVDGRSDIYSLGLVLHEMLTGEKPGGLSPTAKPPGNLPRWITSIVARATAQDPSKRFGRADEMWRALKSGESSSRPFWR